MHIAICSLNIRHREWYDGFVKTVFGTRARMMRVAEERRKVYNGRTVFLLGFALAVFL